MINYIEVGKLVPANKKIIKHKCWGVFDTLWDEVQRNYADREDLAGFGKNDWRSACDRALHFDDLDGCVMSTPNLVVLDAIVNYFLLGYCHHEWVKHCNRVGYLLAAPSMFKPTPQPKINYDCNIEPMSRDFIALELLKHKDIAPVAAFKMADEFILLSDYKEVYRDARGNVLPCERCNKPIEKGQHKHEGQRIYHQTC